MRLSINDDQGFEARSRKATDKLLGLLKQHHDFDTPCAFITKQQVIEIRSASDESIPIDIGILPIDETRLTVNGIKRVVCKHFGISHTDIVSPRRDHKVQRPRMIAIFLAREFTPASLPEIGRRFGDRDHTTILASIRRAGALLAAGDPLSRDIGYLREVLSA